MAMLVAVVVMPLVIIGLQIALGATGGLYNSIYKLWFIVAPIVYCRLNRIDLGREIFKWQNWRNDLGLAVGLGVAGAAIFLGAYAAFGPMLVDETAIIAKIESQFSVTRTTVLLISPFTIAINSMIEEFFYRGFAFGQLYRRNRTLAMLLPATVFTVQHVLFIYHWVTALPLALAILGLAVFALVAQAMYAKADSIVAPWVVHVGGDIAMMAIAARMLL